MVEKKHMGYLQGIDYDQGHFVTAFDLLQEREELERQTFLEDFE